MTQTRSHSRLFALGYVTSLQILNFFVCVGLSLLFLPRFAEVAGWDQGLYLGSAAVGQFGLIAVLAWIVCALLSFILPFRALKPVVFFFNLAVFFFIYADSVTFSQYRFHINGFILNMMFSGAARSIFRMQMTDFAKMILPLGSAIVLQFLFLFLAKKLMTSRFPVIKPALFVLTAILITMTYAHVRHAFADAAYDYQITSVSRNFPLYWPLQMRDILYNHGLVDEKKVRQLAQMKDVKAQGHLNVPLHPLKWGKATEKPNILWLVVDTLRADAFNSQVMPYTWDFSKTTDRYWNHRSGSNGTRGGIFSLFYGISSIYWDTVFSQQAPLWMQTLEKQNYDFAIYASAPLYSPEFDRTVFMDLKHLRLESRRHGKLAASPAVADRWSAEDFMQYLDEKKSKKPFFGFLFFDSVHGRDYPKGRTPFLPVADGPNFIRVNNPQSIQKEKNWYSNSANYDDELIGKVLSKLKQKNLLDNTIILFTADHGEEFNDNHHNYWGHNGNFSDAQIHVPFWIHWPGQTKGRAFTHATSHYDVTPTLLRRVFHLQNAAVDYSYGKDLEDVNTKNSWFIVGSDINYAIRERDQMTVKYPTSLFEIYDNHMNPLPKERLRPQVIGGAIAQIGRYYRK